MRDGRRFARLEQEPQAPARQAAAPEAAAEDRASTTTKSTGSGSAISRTRRAPLPVPVTGGQDGVDAVIAEFAAGGEHVARGLQLGRQDRIAGGREDIQGIGRRPRRSAARHRRPKLPFADDPARDRLGFGGAGARVGACRHSPPMSTPSPISISFGSRTWTSTCGSMSQVKNDLPASPRSISNGSIRVRRNWCSTPRT